MDFHTVLPLSFLYACPIPPASPRSYHRPVIFFAVTAIQLWKETPSLGRSREGGKYKAERKFFIFLCLRLRNGANLEPLFLSTAPCGSDLEPLFATPAVDGITFNAAFLGCPHFTASKWMPPVYPFIELGKGEGIFMGAAKNYSQKSSYRVCPYTPIPQVFLAQSQHRVQNFLKKAIEC
jgi:hypothetical protein